MDQNNEIITQGVNLPTSINHDAEIKADKHNEVLDKLQPVAYTSRFAGTLGTQTMNALRVMAVARPLAYASELGESTRAVIPKSAVRGLYGLSFAYCFADIGVRAHDFKNEGHTNQQVVYSTFDRTLWHGSASMFMPAFTIHTLVKYSRMVINKTAIVQSTPKVGIWGPVIIGLSSIPFIIHPLDHLTDYIMDNTIRKLYKDKLVPEHHNTH
jgi:hypothetical protein